MLLYIIFNVHFLLYVILLMTYYLLFILYSFQTVEMRFDKMQIRTIFLFEFKMGHKAVDTTCNINNAFGPGTANDHAVQQWFKKFCKGDESLEDEVYSSQQLEVDNHQLRASSMLILLQLHKKFPKNSALTILWSFGIWSKLEMCKSSESGCLMNWQQI